jgi:DNA-binding GntR family transcriptional regulator
VLADQPIRQDALAKELGVSKIPLREALARLEQEGLVQSHANRGFFVSPLSAEEAEEVYALRLKLEPDAMASAALAATDEERDLATTTLDQLYDVTHEFGDGVGAFNRAIHRALYAPCHMPVTVHILDRLQVLSERYVRKHLEPLGRDERANREHREMLDIWMRRDAERIRALAHAHISQTLDDLRQQLVSTNRQEP